MYIELILENMYLRVMGTFNSVQSTGPCIFISYFDVFMYRHTAYQVVHHQVHLKEAYQPVTVKMSQKRNLAKLTCTLEAFHQELLMMI